MKKTMMYLPEEMHAYLADEAERRGVSMAEIAREAISEYRTRAEAVPRLNLDAFIGIIDEPGPTTDDSEHVDELLDEYYKVGGKWDQEHGFADSD
ncbi:MAG: CopG family transcriptional regulator [Coriobacteriia bacterium]|nr:CopG family transcriptional regulator [Coriobacteriia bacterium]